MFRGIFLLVFLLSAIFSVPHCHSSVLPEIETDDCVEKQTCISTQDLDVILRVIDIPTRYFDYEEGVLRNDDYMRGKERRLRSRIRAFFQNRLNNSCCDGYERGLNNTCKPKCTQTCFYGICIAPNQCKCFEGWRGDDCSSNCPKDKWGPHCKLDCNCENGASCDAIRGTCSCSKGWIGEYCEDPCPDDYYGYFCEEECRCENDALCDHVDGRCNCTAGYQGPLCKEKCPQGAHGYQCSEECKCQNNAICHHEDGSCNCTAGWTGPICADRCKEGYFGFNCSEICNCYNGAICDFVTGQCTCTAGFYGENCLSECQIDTWGLNCSQQCNCTNGECNAINGSCNCFPGFIGTSCRDRACPSRKWGQNCKHECNCDHEMECHPATGKCWCSAEWTGEDCSLSVKGTSEKQVRKEEVTHQGVNIWVIVLAVSNFVLLLLLIILSIKYRRKYTSSLNKIEGEELIPSFSELSKEDGN